MTIIDILKFMGEMGWLYSRNQISEIENYFSKMIADSRVLTIYDGLDLIAILSFSICCNPYPFYQKSDWDYRKHDPDGTSIYIEHIAAKNFNYEIFRNIYQILESRYPKLQECLWKRYRPKANKIFSMKRRSQYELQNQHSFK